MNNKHQSHPSTPALAQQNAPAEQPKKPYTAPRLTIHGDVKEITRAAATGPDDGLGGGTSGGTG